MTRFFFLQRKLAYPNQQASCVKPYHQVHKTLQAGGFLTLSLGPLLPMSASFWVGISGSDLNRQARGWRKPSDTELWTEMAVLNQSIV